MHLSSSKDSKRNYVDQSEQSTAKTLPTHTGVGWDGSRVCTLSLTHGTKHQAAETRETRFAPKGAAKDHKPPRVLWNPKNHISTRPPGHPGHPAWTALHDDAHLVPSVRGLRAETHQRPARPESGDHRRPLREIGVRNGVRPRWPVSFLGGKPGSFQSSFPRKRRNTWVCFSFRGPAFALVVLLVSLNQQKKEVPTPKTTDPKYEKVDSWGPNHLGERRGKKQTHMPMLKKKDSNITKRTEKTDPINRGSKACPCC